MKTLNRKTTLQAPPVDNITRGIGKAIHLDAQQRLVMVNGLQQYCAEPTPDAYASYAAAIGLAASTPTQVGGSLSGSSQSNVANIGLRTQSITLMRDALYRICEAYANKAINQIQVAALLARSQNLSMVILAVEQLTEAVIPQQATQTSNSASQALANLFTSQDLLDTALERETTAKEKYDSAKAALDTATAELNIAKAEYEAKKGDLNSNTPSKQEAALLALTVQLQKQSAYNMTSAKFDLAKQKYAYTNENKKAIEVAKNKAVTDVQTTATGSGGVGQIVVARQLSEDATKEIAKAIESMVNKALDKSYVTETCLAIITTQREIQSESGIYNMCQLILSNNITREFKDVFNREDNTTEAIRTAIATPKTKEKMIDWLKTKNITSTTLFIYGKDFKDERQEFLNYLNKE